MQIAVRTNGEGPFVPLSPRQLLTATPYALYALSAGRATTVAATNISGVLALPQLPNSLVTNRASSVELNGTFVGDGAGMTNLLRSRFRGDPVVVVSARGTNNGLSSLFNDGADFGPDTPGTSTCGIQEALNSLPQGATNQMTQGGGIVQLGTGRFLCTAQIVFRGDVPMGVTLKGQGGCVGITLQNRILTSGNYTSESFLWDSAYHQVQVGPDRALLPPTLAIDAVANEEGGTNYTVSPNPAPNVVAISYLPSAPFKVTHGGSNVITANLSGIIAPGFKSQSPSTAWNNCPTYGATNRKTNGPTRKLLVGNMLLSTDGLSGTTNASVCVTSPTYATVVAVNGTVISCSSLAVGLGSSDLGELYVAGANGSTNLHVAVNNDTQFSWGPAGPGFTIRPGDRIYRIDKLAMPVLMNSSGASPISHAYPFSIPIEPNSVWWFNVDGSGSCLLNSEYWLYDF